MSRPGVRVPSPALATSQVNRTAARGAVAGIAVATIAASLVGTGTGSAAGTHVRRPKCIAELASAQEVGRGSVRVGRGVRVLSASILPLCTPSTGRAARGRTRHPYVHPYNSPNADVRLARHIGAPWRLPADVRIARAVRDAALKVVILALSVANYKVYGACKVWKQMLRQGDHVGRDQVARLMCELGLRGVVRGKQWRTTIADPDHVRAPDLVKRNFRADRPNVLWVCDFERHEAFLNRAVVKGHRLRLVAASR